MTILTAVPSVAAPSFPLTLRLFGPFTAFVHGCPLVQKRSRKEAWLLALLVLYAPAPLERSRLAGTLWPDATDEAALYNLRRNLVLLRGALGAEAGRLLSPTPRTIRLDLDGADCDLTAFDEAVRTGDPASLQAATALYHGPLLLGCLEEWAQPEREARERAALKALETLAAEARKKKHLEEAAGHLRRMLEIDPLCETACRALMETLAGQSCHAAALETYRAFRRRLRGELNAEPDPQTALLYRSLRAAGQMAADLPSAPPPVLPTLPPGSTLPTPLTTLIGREQDIDAVAAHLDKGRLVTLTGTGGVGKTRLALAVAHRLCEAFPDGAWFADLAPLADPKLLAQTVLAALEAREAPGRSPADALAEFLRSRHLLLVLDNCEHLASACARLSRALLEQCPGLHLLVTSRETLGIAGEVTWRVPSLSLPDSAGKNAAGSAAVRLFVERARGARPGWEPSAADHAGIEEISRRLDGIPLAIEMAAARTRSLPVAGIAARLVDTFRLLSGPSGSPVPRHRTLRAALDWGWDLLDSHEKTLLPRLSAFVGGWTLEAAAEVCREKDRDDWAMLDLLTGLIDKSFVVYEEREGAGRYRLLETIRQYALEKRDQGDPVQEQHAAHFLALAETAEAEIMGTDQAAWLARLETEHDNLRAALDWYELRPEDALPGLRLAGALRQFWWVRGHYSEGTQRLARLLEKTQDQTKQDQTKQDQTEQEQMGAARAKALSGAGHLSIVQGDCAAARVQFEKCLQLHRRMGSRQGIANALGDLGEVARSQNDPARARTLLEESLAINRQLGNPRGMMNPLHNLGKIARSQGDYAGALAWLEEGRAVMEQLGNRQGMANMLISLGNVAYDQEDFAKGRMCYDESLTLLRQLGNPAGIAHALAGLAIAATEQGDYPEAQALLEESLSTFRRLGNPLGLAYTLYHLGNVAFHQSDHAGARTRSEESLTLFREMEDHLGAAIVLESMARLAHRQDHVRRNARLSGAACALRETVGSSLSPKEQKKTDERVFSAREALGEEAFAEAWNAGRAMTCKQAVEYALTLEIRDRIRFGSGSSSVKAAVRQGQQG